jgi:hypothetical protein
MIIRTDFLCDEQLGRGLLPTTHTPFGIETSLSLVVMHAERLQASSQP